MSLPQVSEPLLQPSQDYLMLAFGFVHECFHDFITFIQTKDKAMTLTRLVLLNADKSAVRTIIQITKRPCTGNPENDL